MSLSSPEMKSAYFGIGRRKSSVAKVVLDDEDVQDVEDIEVVDDNQIN